MFHMKGLSKGFGKSPILDNIDFSMNPGERVCLAGDNGAGKSTLLKIICGREKFDDGIFEKRKGLTIGYLDQHGISTLDYGDKDLSLYEFCRKAFLPALTLEKKINKIEEKLATEDDETSIIKLCQVQQELLDKFSEKGGYEVDGRIDGILKELHFPEEWKPKKVCQLSGGWLMKAIFCKLLLSSSDLLVLDEPTNHLDMETLIWLERYLETFSGGILMVSHDRTFINKISQRIVHLEIGKLYSYPGKYELFLQQYSERKELLYKRKKKQERVFEKAQESIDKFRSKARRASQVQSMIKQLDRIEKIELPRQRPTIRFRFPRPPSGNRIALKLEKIYKSYGTQKVLENIDLQVQHGDKLALLGENGVGKTTLLQIIMKLIPSGSGSIQIGDKMRLGYFHQKVNEVLDPEKNLLQTLEDGCPTEMLPRLRTILGSFLFTDDDVYKRIGVLSGGEKNRVLLCRLLLRPNNFLILDEPTNHLDMLSKDILLEALEKFDGTLIFVSHDRYFVNKIATKVCYLESGKYTYYPGDFEYFQYKRGKDLAMYEASLEGFVPEKKNQRQKKTKRKKEKPPEVLLARSRQKRIAITEEKIGNLEEEQNSLLEQLAESYEKNSPSESVELTKKLSRIKKQLEELYIEWESCIT
ncbi:ABC-F family ATP-binding cassette domain-containing protein [Candidatus Riflebacteria bacterium]